MTIRAYHWDDPGAPEIPNVSGQRLIDNLRIIFKACLVDGYGDKPGAGWTLGHDLPDGFSLGNGRGWLNIVAGGNNSSVTIYAIEEITDFSTPEAGGVNKRSAYHSDTYPNTAVLRPNFPGLSGTHNAGMAWTVVADNRTASLMVLAGGSASQFILDANSPYGTVWHFGEFITPLETPGFIALCGVRTTSSNGVGGGSWTANGGTVLRNPFSGLVDQGATPQYWAALPSTSNITFINDNIELHPLGRVSFSRVGVQALGLPETHSDIRFPTPAGTLRGVLSSTEMSAAFSEKILRTIFDIEDPQPEDKFRKLPNILGPDHPGLYMAYPNTSDFGAFISLDPADWE